MTDLVERQAVIDIIHRFFTEEVDKIPTKKTEDGEVLIMCKAQPLFAMNKAICKRIKALPSVTEEEQEPKTGHWITTRTIMHDGEYYCDRCDCDSPKNEKWDYCPNCGARMESEDEE